MNDPTASIDGITATVEVNEVLENQIIRITEDGLAERIYQNSNIEVVNI